jgi:hypothetical protein
MSFRERRDRDKRRERERALVGMRDIVIAAQAGFLRTLGSAAIEDAVDEALARMKPEERLGDPEQVRGLWIHRATRRLINQQKSAEVLHREAVALDEHAQALTVSVSGELNEDARQCWRLEEIVNSVQGEQQRWVEAYAERVLDGSLDLGAQPRGLPEQLGWSTWKTKRTARQARATMAAFIRERASGRVCADRQALLDSFIATDTNARDDGLVLDDERYLAVLLHVGGCHECSLAWRERRQRVTRCVPGVLALPLDVVSWAAGMVHDLASSVDVATLSVRQRLGLGGGAGAAAAGGGAATIGAKAAAVCAAAVCAAGAGGELAGVLPPIVPQPTHQMARRHSVRHHARPARQVLRAASSRVVTPVTPAPPTRQPAQATSVAETPAAPEERFTPGDLPPASSTAGGSSAGSPGLGSSAPTTPPPPAPPPPARAAGGAHCVLGDLGC